MFSSSIKPLVKLDTLYHIIAQCGNLYHISAHNGSSTKSMKKQARKPKIDNSDIPEEPAADEKCFKVITKLVKSLKYCVTNELMGIYTANKLSAELDLGITFRHSDQPRGFCVSNKSQFVYGYWMKMLPKLKSYLKINQ